MSLTHNENTSTLELDDGSGRTDGRYWSHAEDTEAGHNEAHSWQAGVYVRIVGNIRRFKTSTTNSLVVLSVQPIIDHNEITFHMLEAISVHLENLRAAQPSYSSYAPIQTNTYAQNPYVAAPGPSEDDGLDSLSSTIRDLVRHYHQDPNGIHIHYLIEQMGQYNVSEQDTRETVQRLSAEGHIYPTSDEDHFSAQ